MKVKVINRQIKTYGHSLMSQYNLAGEGDLHSFPTPRTPMTRSTAEATGGNTQLPGGREALKRCTGNRDPQQ